MSSIIYFQDVRCSFPHVASPFVSTKFPSSTPMYSIEIIDLDPEHPQVKQFMTQCGNMAMQVWKDHAPTVMQMIQNDRRARCYGMGAEKVNEKNFQQLEGYGSGVWINAKNKSRPQIIRADGQVASNEMEAMDLARKFYGGCYVNVALKPWIRTANKGISCDLVAIQFSRDGKAFGEGTAQNDVSTMFGAVQQTAAPANTPAAMGLPPFMQ